MQCRIKFRTIKRCLSVRHDEELEVLADVDPGAYSGAPNARILRESHKTEKSQMTMRDHIWMHFHAPCTLLYI